MALAAASLAPAAGAQDAALQNDRHLDPTRLLLPWGSWDTRSGWPEPAPELRTEPGSVRYFLVQAPVQSFPAARGTIRARGGAVFDYVPNNAWEARLEPAAAAALAAAGWSVVPVQPGYKLSPGIGSYGTELLDPLGRMLLAVELWPDQDLGEVRGQVAALGLPVLESADSGRYQRLLLRASADELAALARLEGIKWIEESAPGAPRNDHSRWIIQTNVPDDVKLWRAGLTGQNVTIGHIDGGLLYEQSCYFRDPTGIPPGPGHRKIKWWSGGTGGDPHATHTAGSAAGDSFPINGSIFRDGMAPAAFLVHHGYLPTSAGLLTMLNEAYSHGARIHTNSWGNDHTRAYDDWCRDIDAYSHDNEDALVIFAVSNGTIIHNPENAKSACAVAATDRDAPELFGSGGHGPTLDGRLKPEVTAPGCSTYSAAAGSNCLTLPNCGTSMAAPVVAGGAALLKQYFEDGYYPDGAPDPADAFTPSGSLLRACLANSGDDMSGFPGYPGNSEGWGRILLDNVAYFSGDARHLMVLDRLHVQGLSSGHHRSAALSVGGGGELRVTLAFADEPGSSFAADPVVNDLNLLVTAPDGTRYRGNVLDTATGESIPNMQRRDHKNSLETVIVHQPLAGVWTITVEAQDVPVGPQGYALVATY